jgi:hypothetical protein
MNRHTITVLEFGAHGNTIDREAMNQIEQTTPGTWIPLMDYAIKKSISLSTLRRHIKANKITHKVENGRYMIWDESQVPSENLNSEVPSDSIVETLEKELRKAQEEIAELKMLIALYEETIPQSVSNN